MNILRKFKNFIILLLISGFGMVLVACAEAPEELGDHIIYMVNGEVINSQPIHDNRVNDFVPGIEHNHHNRDFTGWYFNPGNGLPDVPFNPSDVGDVREVHARFDDENVAIPLFVTIIDESPTRPPVVNLEGRPATVTSSMTPITIRGILDILNRDVEEYEFRRLSWFNLGEDGELIRDENGDLDQSELIDIDAISFRFVELRALVEEGIRVGGVQRIQPQRIVINPAGVISNENGDITLGTELSEADREQIQMAALEVATIDNSFIPPQNSGLIGIEVPWGAQVNSHISVPLLWSQSTLPGYRLVGLRYFDHASGANMLLRNSQEISEIFHSGFLMLENQIDLTLVWEPVEVTLLLTCQYAENETDLLHGGFEIVTYFGANIFEVLERYNLQTLPNYTVGRDFDGWQMNYTVSGINQTPDVTQSSTVANVDLVDGKRVITLNSTWVDAINTITFVYGGGNEEIVRDVNFTFETEWDVILNYLSLPKPNGFTYLAIDNLWRLPSGRDPRIEFPGGMPAQDITLEAQYTRDILQLNVEIPSNVTFAEGTIPTDAVLNSTFYTIQFEFEAELYEYLEEIFIALLTGYTFTHWTTVGQSPLGEHGIQISLGTKMPHTELTIRPNFARNVHEITFYSSREGNIVNSSTEAMVEIIELEYDRPIFTAMQHVTFIGSDLGLEERSPFIGWQLGANVITDTNIRMPDRNIELHAAFEAVGVEAIRVTVQTGHPDATLPGGDFFEILPNQSIRGFLNDGYTPTRYGWEITAWSMVRTGVGGEPVVIANGETFNAPEWDVTITALWKEVESRIMFENLAGRTLTDTQTGETITTGYFVGYVGNAIDLSRFKLEMPIGYSHDGWQIGLFNPTTVTSHTLSYNTITINPIISDDNIVVTLNGVDNEWNGEVLDFTLLVQPLYTLEFRKGTTLAEIFKHFTDHRANYLTFMENTIRLNGMRRINATQGDIVNDGVVRDIEVRFVLERFASTLTVDFGGQWPSAVGMTGIAPLIIEHDTLIYPLLERTLIPGSNMNLANLGSSASADFLHWQLRVGSTDGDIITSSSGRMPDSDARIIAQWYFPNRISINGLGGLFSNSGIPTTLSFSVASDADIRSELTTLRNNLMTNLSYHHPSHGLLSVSDSRELLGFYLASDYKTNILLTEDALNFAAGSSVFEVTAIVRNISLNQWTFRRESDGNASVTFAGSNSNNNFSQGLVIPSFTRNQNGVANGLPVTTINVAHSQHGVFYKDPTFGRHIMLPMYLEELVNISAAVSDAMNELTLHLENMPNLTNISTTALGNNLSRISPANGGRLTISINRVTPINALRVRWNAIGELRLEGNWNSAPRWFLPTANHFFNSSEWTNTNVAVFNVLHVTGSNQEVRFAEIIRSGTNQAGGWVGYLNNIPTYMRPINGVSQPFVWG